MLASIQVFAALCRVGLIPDLILRVFSVPDLSGEVIWGLCTQLHAGEAARLRLSVRYFLVTICSIIISNVPVQHRNVGGANISVPDLKQCLPSVREQRVRRVRMFLWKARSLS